jgi:uncharacterized protein (DUF2141 family)
MRPVLLAALLLSACAAVGAQAPLVGATLATGSGSIAGKLTDLRSVPLSGATVIARNESTAVETQSVTKKNGSFRFTGLEPGSYTVEAASGSLGRGRLEGIVVSVGHEAQVQASMAF